MTTVLGGPATELERDLARAAAELAEARERQRRKDTPAHRRAVAECLARLDGYLEAPHRAVRG